MQPSPSWRVMPEHLVFLARLGKVHLHEAESDYSELPGAKKDLSSVFTGCYYLAYPVCS